MSWLPWINPSLEWWNGLSGPSLWTLWIPKRWLDGKIKSDVRPGPCNTYEDLMEEQRYGLWLTSENRWYGFYTDHGGHFSSMTEPYPLTLDEARHEHSIWDRM